MKEKTAWSRLLRLLVICSFLSAISIVLGKYLAINAGEVLRFSFENLPIIFAGMAFGPLAGLAVGTVADLVGCLLVGYAINPIVTLGAASVGAISGIYVFLPRTGGGVSHFLRISLAVASAHIIGSVVIKTLGLAAFYAMPVGVLMLWRLLNYLIVGALEGFLLYHLMKNRRIQSEINAIMRFRK